jgi:DNA (cytosine-5)-methyltransferase 1
MRFLSLFSGIGALDLGLCWAGWTPVGQVELDPYWRAVLEHHWPGLPRWEDVRELRADDVMARCGRPDAIVGGFPCQPHSVAGKRKGRDDERHLWPEYARLVRELRPPLGAR